MNHHRVTATIDQLIRTSQEKIMLRRKSVCTFLAIVTVFGITTGAQAALIANYAFSDGASPAATTADANITAGNFTISGGTLTIDSSEPNNGNTSSSGPNMAGGNIGTGNYFTFTLTPDLGFALTIDSISFEIGKQSGGNANDQLHAVVGDGTPALLGSFTIPRAANTSALSSRSVNVTTLNGVTAPIEFRISADSDENYGIDDIVVNGTVIPEPASLALMGLGGLLMLGRRRQGV